MRHRLGKSLAAAVVLTLAVAVKVSAPDWARAAATAATDTAMERSPRIAVCRNVMLRPLSPKRQPDCSDV